MIFVKLIKTDYRIQEIADLKIVSEINEHAKLYIKGIIEYEEDFLYNTTENDIMQVYLDDEAETVVFTGVVTEISLKYEQGVCYANIYCESCTSLMDVKVKSHSFQNKKMKYKELTEKINQSYSKADCICTLEKDKTTGMMLVQYKETDWEFLKRVATHENSFLVADYESAFAKYWLGMPEKQTPEMIELPKSDANELREFLETKEEISHYEFEVNMYEDYKIGDVVKLSNYTLTITKKVIKLEDGILQFTYTLENPSYVKTKERKNRKIQGASIEGRILDVALNQVKIHLNIDSEQDKATAHWFPYSAEANNVWY